MKKRIVWWKITNYHLYGAIGVYALMSLTQIGLPEQFEGTREVLTLIQLVLLFILSFLVLVNLFRNWE